MHIFKAKKQVSNLPVFRQLDVRYGLCQTQQWKVYLGLDILHNGFKSSKRLQKG